MIWIIESTKKLSREFAADLKRLRANPAVAEHLTRKLMSSTIAEMKAPLSPALDPGEPLLILAHSGYDKRDGEKEPWIGGRWLDEFVQDIIAKFTPAGLSGRTLWFLVCHVGQDVTVLAEKLAAAGVNDVTIYMPTDFMYVSTAGIPHVLISDADLDTINAMVAKYNSEYLTVPGSQPTGSYWAGCEISAQVVTKLSGNEVEDAVKEQFDPDEEEA